VVYISPTDRTAEKGSGEVTLTLMIYLKNPQGKKEEL
jgi:hypothetical protein